LVPPGARPSPNPLKVTRARFDARRWSEMARNRSPMRRQSAVRSAPPGWRSGTKKPELPHVTTRRLVNFLRRPLRAVEVARGVALFCAIEILVRSTKLSRAIHIVGASLEFSERPPGRDFRSLHIEPAQVRSLMILTRVARRWPFGPPGACLRHSLAAAYVLRNRAPKLRLAVGSVDSRELTAHAWLEVDGTAVTDPGSTYLPLLESGGAEL
jgi:hypothetical protein